MKGLAVGRGSIPAELTRPHFEALFALAGQVLAGLLPASWDAPLLGAETMMPDELEVQPDEATPPEGGQPAEPPEGGEPAPPEYFLEVNDRTRYRDAEEAKRGYQNLQERLTSYSRHGDPEEIGKRLNQLSLLEKMLSGQDQPDTPKGTWTKEQIDQNKEWLAGQRRWLQWMRESGLLAEMGFMTKGEYDAMTAQQQEDTRRELVGQANEAGLKWMQDHGIEITPEEAWEAMEACGHWVTGNQRLNDLFFGGKIAEAVDTALSRYFAAELKSKEPPPTDPAQPNGARAAAAQRQATGDKTKKLLSPPPKTGAPAGEKPPVRNLADPKERRKYMDELLQERVPHLPATAG